MSRCLSFKKNSSLNESRGPCENEGYFPKLSVMAAASKEWHGFYGLWSSRKGFDGQQMLRGWLCSSYKERLWSGD